jgi:hypothetical protein
MSAIPEVHPCNGKALEASDEAQGESPDAIHAHIRNQIGPKGKKKKKPGTANPTTAIFPPPERAETIRLRMG